MCAPPAPPPAPPPAHAAHAAQDGALAVPQGRAIAPAVNALLALPFAVKLATRDAHPPSHVSFAASHGDAASPPPPPFVSSALVRHPADARRAHAITLWPVHCVRGTPGAALAAELDAARLDAVVDKGTRADVEMHSAFYDPLRVCDSGVAARLRARAVTDVFIVGLAADYCVKATAESALDEGFAAYVVDEGTRPVFPDKWPEVRAELQVKGVHMVSIDGPHVARVASLAQQRAAPS